MEFVIKGVKIRFTFLFFWMLTLFCLIDRSGILLWGVFAAFIHELGHIIAFVLVGDLPEELSFEITGIKMVRSGKAITSARLHLPCSKCRCSMPRGCGWHHGSIP